ncbi:MAG: hypothetical protein MUC65_05690 [Pontiellaceae bacterium]|jgi:hypothetical protein|nr:hypothetical protein [Pontiellaceae bacterium]
MSLNGFKKIFIRHKALIATAILLILSLTGVIQKGTTRVCGQLTQSNRQFLDRSIESTLHLMVPVAIVKGVTDVIEGSTLGVEWGDIAQPLLDYIDIAWRILLLSLITSTAIKYILLGAAPLANSFLVISLCFYLAMLIAGYWRATLAGLCVTLKRIAALCLLGYLLFTAIFPLTVFVTARLSQSITDPLREEIRQTFSAFSEVFSIDSITKQKGFTAKADAIKEKAEEIIRFCGSGAITALAQSVAKLAVVKVLEGVVFPLGALVFLIWFVRGTLYPVLGLSNKSLARSDLNKIEKFLKPKQQLQKTEEQDGRSD